ncbi:MAG: enoyl-CoA hydratase/isomerase family protein [Candidatus Hodarchaeota archaeon]
MLDIEYKETVGILKLNREITNALNSELIRKLTEALHTMESDPEVRSLVFSSSNEKFFSIGLDIPELFNLSKEEFAEFYHSYNNFCIDLYTFPKPTIAAITGHAIAGGCIITLCCDYRLIAEGRKLMGLNEIKLGVPIPYPGDCILRQLVGIKIAREITDIGDFYDAEALLKIGMVDEVIPINQLLSISIERAHKLSSLPLDAFIKIKRNRIEAVENQVRKNIKEKEKQFIESWYMDTTRERLKEAMTKF